MARTKTGLRVSTFLLNSFWRALYGLNAFLYALLAFQCALAAAVYFDFRISLPEFVREQIEEAAEEAGLDLEISALRIDFRGNIEADSVAARFNGTPEDFFKARKVCATLGLAPLLRGEFVPESLRIIDGRVGATYADVDKTPALKSLYFDASKRGEWWKINACRFSSAGVSVSLSGFVNENFDPSSAFGGLPAKSDAGSADAGQSATPARRFDAAMSKFPEFKKYADMFSAPALNAEFVFYAGGACSAEAALVAGGATFDLLGADADARNFRVRLSYDGTRGTDSLSVSASAENFSREKFPSFENVSARAGVVFDGGYVGLENVEIAANKISYDGTDIGNVAVSKSSLDTANWRGGWRVFASMGAHRFGGEFSVSEKGRVRFGFDGVFDPRPLLARRELADIPELKQLDFPNGISLSGGGWVSAESGDADVRMRVRADNCLVMNIPVSALSGDVSYSGGVMRAENLSVATREGWRVGGEFIQNFDTLQYRVRVVGNIRPMAIAHFMEDWWTRVMKDFKFRGGKNFPYADVSVEGTWGKPEYMWCYARASGADAEYSGVEFSSFSLNVLVAPERISLYNVDIDAGGRRANGTIEWLYLKDGITSFDEQRIAFDSELSPSELVALGGDDVREVFDVVQFKSPPKLKFSALLRNPENNPKKLSDIFNAQAEVAGETVVENVATLVGAKFTARSDKIDTLIENASFEFCGGKTEGSVALHKTEKSMEFDGSFRADKMNQAAFTDFLYSLGSDGGSADEKNAREKSANAAPPQKKKSIVDGGENGTVSMSIALKGDVAHFEDAVGSGYAGVENADLIRLNLFGVLSRALSAMRLPFGSFDITYALSPFEISGGAVKFPKLEMGGAVMQIKGAAAYDFVRDDLDASLAIRPFGGLTMPIVSSVAAILNPIANTVEVRLDGKLSDPEVDVKVNPVKILKSEEAVLEDMRDSL